MNVHFARPDISQLMFYVYSRALHPELFSVRAERRINAGDYQAVVQICDVGHVVTFRQKDQPLLEIMTADQQSLPHHRRLVDRRIQGCRNAACQLGDGVEYQVSYQLERLDPAVFLQAHEELAEDCRTADLAHVFPAVHRFSASPLSLIRLAVDRRSLLVHAFHTFPESYAVVKTQSLIEF